MLAFSVKDDKYEKTSNRSRLVRSRYWVIGVAAALIVLAGLAGHGVSRYLVNGGMVSPGSESTRANAALTEGFPGAEPNVVLMVGSELPLDDRAVREVGLALTDRLRSEPGATAVASYWAPGGETLIAADGDSALVTARLPFSTSEERTAARQLLEEVDGSFAPLQIQAGGPVAVAQDIEVQSAHDLHLAELLALPLMLLLMLLVFRGLLAAALPVLVGVISMMGTLALLRGLTEFMDVSVFALNVTTALGFAMGVDFSLFVVSRFREELAGGASVPDAVAASVRKAGRIVVFSAAISIMTFAGMLVFPLGFLRSIALAAIAVMALAAVVALTVLPALLAVFGRNIDRFDPFVRLRRSRDVLGREGFWHRTATLVMRRPVLVALPVVAVLLLLASPFRDAAFSLGDDRLLPTTAPAYQATEAWRTDFPTAPTRVDVVLDGPSAADPATLDRYARSLSALPQVASLETASGRYAAGERLSALCDQTAAVTDPDCAGLLRYASESGAWIAVRSDVEPDSAAAADLVGAVRAEPAPEPVLVGGSAADLVDVKAVIAERLPWSLTWIALAMLVLLFLLTRSVFLPVKAIAVNLLSLTATFGAIVFIFQQGHLRWLTGDFQVTGTTNLLMPILVFCLAFGLSMDYEVLLLSRIREEYLITGDTVRATALGLERTGWLFTSSAAIVATVTVCLATSGMTPLKLLGVGLTLAVLLDATLIRALLVPAVMRLAGSANWWAPRLLRPRR
jgi:putative drug exporter of the RND superfamily